MQLNTEELISLAENGKIVCMLCDKVNNFWYPITIELDDMAKAVLGECAYMMNFERDCYLKGKKNK